MREKVPILKNFIDNTSILGLDILDELIEDDETEIALSLIDNFLRETPQQLRQLKQAIAHEDNKNVDVVAHALKSTCRIFGIHKMSSICRELELAGMSNKLDNAFEKFIELENDYAHVKGILENVRTMILTNSS